MKRAECIPIGEETARTFGFPILEYAGERKDAAIFEEGLQALKSKFGADSRLKSVLLEKEAVLKKVKGAE